MAEAANQALQTYKERVKIVHYTSYLWIYNSKYKSSGYTANKMVGISIILSFWNTLLRIQLTLYQNENNTITIKWKIFLPKNSNLR